MLCTMVPTSSVSGKNIACSSRADVVENTRQIGDFVKSTENLTLLRSRVPRNSQNYVKISTNTTSYPELRILNASGVLTSNASTTPEELRSGTHGYGQAVLITPCHWLTNLHVATGIAIERGESISIGSRAFGSFGQGELCDGAKNFKVWGVGGKLVAFNKDAYIVDHDKVGIDDSRDWAIYRIDKQIQDVPYATLGRFEFLFGRIALLAGNPFAKLDEDGFGLLGISLVESDYAAGPGVMVLRDKANQPGRSGGGLFLPDEQGGLVLSAIYVGSGNVLNIKEIFQQLKAYHFDVLKEISSALKTGTCVAR